MKLEIALVLLCIITVISYSVGQPEILECIRDLEDFEMYKWTTDKLLRYAEDSSELPSGTMKALEGKGIFYQDGSQGDSIQDFFKPGGDLVHIKPAYMYLKYYAHVETVTYQAIYAFPGLPQSPQYLAHAPDFTWREALIEINVDKIGSGDYDFDLSAVMVRSLIYGDFFLLDTIILAQGANISGVAEIKALCPPKIEPTTITEPSTTTEKPSDSILECIDNQQDFDSDGWNSYPTHKYSQNSSSLPAGLGNLTGEGIFYFSEVPPSPHHVFFKDYSSKFEGQGGPAYVYLKYYVHLTRNDQQNQTAYVQPVKFVPFVPGEYSLDLGPSTDFVWQEKLLEIDIGNTIVGSLMEIGIFNIQPGELLLIDKIIVSRGSTLTETLQQIMSCLSDENVLIQNLLSWADQK